MAIFTYSGRTEEDSESAAVDSYSEIICELSKRYIGRHVSWIPTLKFWGSTFLPSYTFLKAAEQSKIESRRLLISYCEVVCELKVSAVAYLNQRPRWIPSVQFRRSTLFPSLHFVRIAAEPLKITISLL
jgi:hypothetical protein